MLNRNWLRYAALVIWAAFAAYFLVVTAQGVWSLYETYRSDYEGYQQRAAQERRHASEKIAARCTIPNAPDSIVTRCLTEQIAAYDQQKSTNQDLQAQRDMAFWAFWMVLLGAINLLVSVGGLWLVWTSLRHTRQALTLNREVGHAQVRAYLTVETGNSGPISQTHHFQTPFIIQNTGQSPAYAMYYLYSLGEVSHPVADLPMPVSAEEPLRPTATVAATGKVFATAKAQNLLTLDQIKSVMGGGATRLYLIGVVHYTDVFKQKRFTRFCYFLDTEDGTYPKRGESRTYRWHTAPNNNEAD